MDLQKTKILLDKINRLHQGFQDSNGSINQIEKKLMLDYLSTMYDAMLSNDLNATQKVSKTKATTSQPVITKPAPQKEVSVQKPIPVVKKPAPVVEKPEPIVEKPVVHKPVVQPAQKPTPKPRPVVQRVEPVKPVPKKEKPIEPAPPTPTSKATGFNKMYDELFTFESAGELSDKLANKPIKSIKKAMGINERYLISNELFKGNNSSFEETIKQLDKFDSFDEARSFLEKGTIEEFGWNEPEKLKQVNNFLKLVRSRYSS